MSHPDAHYIPALVDAANYLSEHVRPGEVLLTLGAGDGNWVGQKVYEVLMQSGSAQ